VVVAQVVDSDFAAVEAWPLLGAPLVGTDVHRKPPADDGSSGPSRRLINEVPDKCPCIELTICQARQRS